jgi:hypothetical protein
MVPAIIGVGEPPKAETVTQSSSGLQQLILLSDDVKYKSWQEQNTYFKHFIDVVTESKDCLSVYVLFYVFCV